MSNSNVKRTKIKCIIFFLHKFVISMLYSYQLHSMILKSYLDSVSIVSFSWLVLWRFYVLAAFLQSFKGVEH